MTRRTWAGLLALFALIGLAVPFLGTSVPSCFAPAGGQVSAECLANWEAGRSAAERFVEAVGVPGSTLLTFVVLVGITLLVDRTLRRRSRPGR